MAAITVNVEQEDKELFNSICNKLGMNISTAINIFIKKVNATRSIPFSLELELEWNEETIAAFEEARANIWKELTESWKIVSIPRYNDGYEGCWYCIYRGMTLGSAWGLL